LSPTLKTFRDEKGILRREKYGLLFPANWSNLDIDLWCFRVGRTKDQGGLGKDEHWWKVVDYFWGPNNPVRNTSKYFIRNPVSEEMIYHACRERYVAVGAGSGWTKSETFGLWLLVNQLANARRFLGLFVSTSLKDAKKRGWGSLVSFIQAVPHNILPVRVLESGIIKYESPTFKSTDQQSISLIAWEKKQEKEAVSKAQGMHNDFVCLVVDEMTELPPSVLEYALPGGNLSANPSYQCIGLANPLIYFDTFAQLWKPKDGWTSISVNSDVWRLESTGGIGLHYDGMRSPNIPTAIYKTPYGVPFLPTQEKLDEAIQAPGAEKSVRFWRMFRGFPCPIGNEDLIYSPIDVIKFKGDIPAIWGDQPLIRLAALDPGFTNGGDSCALTFFTLGRDKDGLLVLQVDRQIELFEDVTDKEHNRSEQIATQVKNYCAAERIFSPHYLAVDSTGAGGPLCDVIDLVWARGCLRVNFGGDASELAVSMTDMTPANKRYKNRATEIWYRGVDLLRQGQLKGIPPKMAAQMIMRHYSYVGADNLILAEPKPDMKLRTGGESPDFAESGFIGITLAVERFGLIAVLSSVQKKTGKSTTWRQFHQRRSARLALPTNLSSRKLQSWTNNPES
jgi:hypothetical protein